MRSEKYYIEFTGQHTAGKTSIIREIVDRELLVPRVAVYPQKLRRSRLHFILSLPILVLLNVHHLWFVVFFFARYARWNWINYHSAGRHLIKMVLLHPYYARFRFDVWMKDDMLHLLPRVEFRSDIDVAAVFREYFVHFAYRYDGIVYVELPYEVMRMRFEARFRTRNAKRRENRTPVYERAFRQNALLRQVLTEQADVPVLVLDGTGDVSENAAQVVEFIQTRVYEH